MGNKRDSSFRKKELFYSIPHPTIKKVKIQSFKHVPSRDTFSWQVQDVIH